MKLYRQTARFVLFGLVIASMVFGFQTSAMAGAGPEPQDCAPAGAKAKYLAGPYIVDFVAKIKFTDVNIAALAFLDITVTKEGKKKCTVSTGTEPRSNLYTLSDFEEETSKDWLLSTCFSHTSYTGSGQEPLFCEMQNTIHPLDVIAVAEYKKVGEPLSGITVTARLIVMEVTY